MSIGPVGLCKLFLIDAAVVIAVKASHETSHPLGDFFFAELAVFVAIKFHQPFGK
jgi:hypothetical protein